MTSIVPILARSIIRRKAAVPAPIGGLYTLPTTANLELWLNAQTGVITDGSGVATWQDQSPRGANATRQAGNYQIVAGDLNGFDALNSGTNGSFLFSPASIVPATGWTAFVVALPAGDTMALGAQTTNIQLRIRRANAQQMSFFNGVERFWTLPTGFTNYSIFEWWQLGTALELRQNGAAFTTTTTITTNFSLGGIGYYFSSSFSNFKVTDIILYSAPLSTGDRATIRATLGTRYGITVV